MYDRKTLAAEVDALAERANKEGLTGEGALLSMIAQVIEAGEARGLAALMLTGIDLPRGQRFPVKHRPMGRRRHHGMRASRM